MDHTVQFENDPEWEQLANEIMDRLEKKDIRQGKRENRKPPKKTNKI